MCAFLRFLTFADFSKTMLRKHTKSIHDESAVSLPGVRQKGVPMFWRGARVRFAVPLPCFRVRRFHCSGERFPARYRRFYPARAVVQMAGANERRNDEEEAGTTARRARMVFADRQAWWHVQESGQARGHRQERQEGRMAERQAAQGFVRNLFFPARPSPPHLAQGAFLGGRHSCRRGFCGSQFLENFLH
jgi:hypothetical protein